MFLLHTPLQEPTFRKLLGKFSEILSYFYRLCHVKIGTIRPSSNKIWTDLKGEKQCRALQALLGERHGNGCEVGMPVP